MIKIENSPPREIDLGRIKYADRTPCDLRKPVLLGCSQERCVNGNKEWQIKLSMFQVAFRVGDVAYGKPLTGSLSCHRTGSFTTYAINMDGRDFWFDSLELALSAVREGVLPNLGKNA